LDLFGFVMFLNKSGDSVPVVYLIFLLDMINVLEDGYNWGHAILSCRYFNFCRSYLEEVNCIAGPFASALDVVLDKIPDRETEVINYHVPQLRSFM
jgi:hypothetical protein